VTGFRLTHDEIWAYVADAHTGIMTTLRRDGMPIAMPLWFAALDEAIYVSTRGKKVQRVRNDPRASFLVESGEAWRDLMAVHFTGTVAVVEPEGELLERVEAELNRKYDPYRTDPAAMPEHIAAVYGTGMRWLRFTPDERMLSWNNRALLERSPATHAAVDHSLAPEEPRP
jgi:nitroimidazol reductase NimA-like FMN-containing flavoprotein (pyridoxamine 5'-phosphate oxidase superfamily)